MMDKPDSSSVRRLCTLERPYGDIPIFLFAIFPRARIYSYSSRLRKVVPEIFESEGGGYTVYTTKQPSHAYHKRVRGRRGGRGQWTIKFAVWTGKSCNTHAFLPGCSGVTFSNQCSDLLSYCVRFLVRRLLYFVVCDHDAYVIPGNKCAVCSIARAKWDLVGWKAPEYIHRSSSYVILLRPMRVYCTPSGQGCVDKILSGNSREPIKIHRALIEVGSLKGDASWFDVSKP